MKRKEGKDALSKGAASGMVALVFLVLGFQLAIFVVKVVQRPAKEALPEGQGITLASDTAMQSPPPESVYRSGPRPSESPATGKTKLGGYARPAASNRPAAAERPRRTYESFAFDPNTVSLEDLQRLGLSARQAESIGNYREKGGRFRSKADFAKMYVVSDTLFARLEPYIEIPRLELNTADSTALVSLRGIGPWYARKIIDYRERLGGFVAAEQLLEIEGFDRERFDGLADAVTVNARLRRPIDLWHAPDSVLARHPYLGAKGARSIVRYRGLYDSARWTLPDLAREGALTEKTIVKIKKYIENQ